MKTKPSKITKTSRLVLIEIASLYQRQNNWGKVSWFPNWIVQAQTREAVPFLWRREDVVQTSPWKFTNRTGTSVDEGARKSNNWLEQWQSCKLGTESRVWTFPRAFPSSTDVPVLMLNQAQNAVPWPLPSPSYVNRCISEKVKVRCTYGEAYLELFKDF